MCKQTYYVTRTHLYGFAENDFAYNLGPIRKIKTREYRREREQRLHVKILLKAGSLKDCIAGLVGVIANR